MKITASKQRNHVHQHSWELNKAKVEEDKKKKSKRGYQKHKCKEYIS